MDTLKEILKELNNRLESVEERIETIESDINAIYQILDKHCIW